MPVYPLTTSYGKLSPCKNSLQQQYHFSSVGLELSFYSGVYGTCIGATAQFGEAAKGLIGISGIVVGIGEIVGKFMVLAVILFKSISAYL